MHICYHNKEYRSDPKRTADEAGKEIQDGLSMLNSISHPIVGVFGSHSIDPEHEQYQHCLQTATLLANNGFGIVSGGGPGIMEAANKGAKDAGLPSIGIKAGLLEGEQIADNVHTHSMSCTFMFVRRFLLSINSHALVFYPGGYGTLNELFEYVVLIQTKMLEPVPVVCVGKEFWQGMRSWIEDKLVNTHMITPDQINLIQYVDSPEEVLSAIQSTS